MNQIISHSHGIVVHFIVEDDSQFNNMEFLFIYLKFI